MSDLRSQDLDMRYGVALAKDITKSNTYQNLIIILLSLLGVILVGFRDNAGVDWKSYLGIYQDIGINKIIPFPSFEIISDNILTTSIEPSYWLINKISYWIGGKIYLVNFICALIIFIASYFFCKAQKSPLLSWVCLSYILFFISMNFTRQTVAISIILLGLIQLARGNYINFIGLTCLAGSFHYPAMIMLGFIIIDKAKFDVFKNNKYFRWGILVLLTILSVNIVNKILLYFYVWTLSKIYLFQSDYLNYFSLLVSIGIFFKYRLEFQQKLPNWYPILDLACKLSLVMLVMCSFATIAFTRMLFYFCFIQPLVLTTAIGFLESKRRQLLSGVLLIIFYGIYMQTLFSNVYERMVFNYHSVLTNYLKF